MPTRKVLTNSEILRGIPRDINSDGVLNKYRNKIAPSKGQATLRCMYIVQTSLNLKKPSTFFYYCWRSASFVYFTAKKLLLPIVGSHRYCIAPTGRNYLCNYILFCYPRLDAVDAVDIPGGFRVDSGRIPCSWEFLTSCLQTVNMLIFVFSSGTLGINVSWILGV